MKTKNLISYIGNTPLLYIESLSKLTGCEIYGKAEFMNPGGSIKDRAALGMILDAEKKGTLKKGMTIFEGTAGNTGIGLAMLGNILGYKCKFVIPNTQAKEKFDIIHAYGAETLAVPFVAYPDPLNYQKIAERLAKEEGGLFINQFDNPSNYMYHYETTGREICAQIGDTLTTFITAIGTGGTLTGIARALKERNPKIRVGMVDPPGSAMFNWFTKGKAEVSAGESITEGIGQGRVTENVRPVHVDYSFQLNDQVVVDMSSYVLRHDGLFLGSSAAANVCGAYLSAKKFGPGQKIVTMLCDSGQKYVSKLYNPEFLATKGLSINRPADIMFQDLAKCLS